MVEADLHPADLAPALNPLLDNVCADDAQPADQPGTSIWTVWAGCSAERLRGPATFGAVHRVSIAVMVALVASITACSSESSSPDFTSPSPWVSTSTVPLKSQAGWCYARNPKPAGTYRKVECTDPAAEATVVQINFAEDTTSGGEYRYDCTVDEIDFFLDLDAQPPIEVASTGKGRQFACMETTKGPHADEPGGGKAPIVAGDCVHPSEPVKKGLLETRYVGEIRCAQADVFLPAYKVTAIGKGITCPSGTDLTFVITPLGSTNGETACAYKI